MASSPFVTDPASEEQSRRKALPAASPFRLFTHQKDLLAWHAKLRALAERCEQPGVLDQMEFYISAARLRARCPHLLLLPGPGDDLDAAVFLHEYRIQGVPTRLFLPGDAGGERCVVAPRHERCAIAWRAAEYLMGHGALLVLMSVSDVDFSPGRSSTVLRMKAGRDWATQNRSMLRTLHLEPTYEQTLAKMGPSTRRNLKRYSRRLFEEMGATFVSNPEITEAEFLRLAQSSAFPISRKRARWRFRMARHLPNSVFLGLRSSDGRWLSVLGGRRQKDLTEIDWQVNLDGLRDNSVVSAMRACLLQHEIERGTRRLRFEGGTAHSMRLSFEEERCGDLLLIRRPLTRHLVEKVLPRILPSTSFLGAVLREGHFTWHSFPQ